MLLAGLPQSSGARHGLSSLGEPSDREVEQDCSTYESKLRHSSVSRRIRGLLSLGSNENACTVKRMRDTSSSDTSVKKLLVLGAGTAGTMAANRLRKVLANEWEITVVDNDPIHLYQPGLLFVPFGTYTRSDLIRPKARLLRKGIRLLEAAVDALDPESNSVKLQDGTELNYDYLIIATGTNIAPEQTEGLGAAGWSDSVHEFYTIEGAEALADKLATWSGGKLVVHISEMPIKCPVAPLEFSFLADAFFEDKGIRDKVEISYVTPLPGAFTKPVAAKMLGGMLDERDIALEEDFYVERVDAERNVLVSYDEREIPFDLLVTVPVNMGAEFVASSGLGDELRHVRVDKHTMQSTDYDNIFALGDAADLPTSKAGSVAHFSVEIFAENFVNYIDGKEMTELFDGHANCYIESGHGKASLIDFNYDVQPLSGKYPMAKVGPFSLLSETRINHWGKLAFKWVYWHFLMPGRNLLLAPHMSMHGKKQVVEVPESDEIDVSEGPPKSSDDVTIPSF